ncbi:MAG TPA: relaxase/mobilization nuclease domain-containing protein [Chryseosolibacter sp.]
MVCKVRSGKNIKGALNYNEQKVKAGVAECIGAVNFVGEPQQLRFSDKLARFEHLIEKNSRAKTNCVHISLNFDVSENLNQNKLNEIAADYMAKIGFGNQPYLVYQHNDAAHPHLHIVTTNIQENGKRISIHNLGKNQSEFARKEIEEKYWLVKAGATPKQSVDINLNRALYGKSETKKSIDNIVGEVMRRYKFSSLTEFNAVLRQYNVLADRGKEGMIMFSKKGLLYSVLDAKGNKIGVPIKASALLCKPTLKNLEEHFQRGTVLKQDGKERLTNTVNLFFHVHDRHSRTSFCDYMASQGISALFRENKEGRVYGLTFIDNKSGAVFNGRDLGKPYSGQALAKRIDNTSPVQTEVQQRYEWNRQALDIEKSGHSATNPAQDLANIVSTLMKAEKSGQEGINPALKKDNRKKKRRGLSL